MESFPFLILQNQSTQALKSTKRDNHIQTLMTINIKLLRFDELNDKSKVIRRSE